MAVCKQRLEHTEAHLTGSFVVNELDVQLNWIRLAVNIRTFTWS